jgi:hypothetical protein
MATAQVLALVCRRVLCAFWPSALTDQISQQREE